MLPTLTETRAAISGGVDKFEPVSGEGEMDHSEETVGKLVVADGDCAVDLELDVPNQLNITSLPAPAPTTTIMGSASLTR